MDINKKMGVSIDVRTIRDEFEYTKGSGTFFNMPIKKREITVYPVKKRLKFERKFARFLRKYPVKRSIFYKRKRYNNA